VHRRVWHSTWGKYGVLILRPMISCLGYSTISYSIFTSLDRPLGDPSLLAGWKLYLVRPMDQARMAKTLWHMHACMHACWHSVEPKMHMRSCSIMSSLREQKRDAGRERWTDQGFISYLWISLWMFPPHEHHDDWSG
jgi:hypothetical protein